MKFTLGIASNGSLPECGIVNYITSAICMGTTVTWMWQTECEITGVTWSSV